MSRTHGVNVAWSHEVFQRSGLGLYCQPTLGQRGDILTKPLTTAATWRRACDLIAIISDDVTGKGRSGGNAVQGWADRVRAAQAPGLSMTGGERKKATCPLRASHDNPITNLSTDTARTFAVAAAVTGDAQGSRELIPTLCMGAPVRLFPLPRIPSGSPRRGVMASYVTSGATGAG